MDWRIILKWAFKNSGLIAWFRIWSTDHSVWYIVPKLLFQYKVNTYLATVSFCIGCSFDL